MGDEAGAAQPVINVVVPGPDLRVEQFEIDDNPMITAEKWDIWIEDLEEAMDYHQLVGDWKIEENYRHLSNSAGKK